MYYKQLTLQNCSLMLKVHEAIYELKNNGLHLQNIKVYIFSYKFRFFK